MKFAETKGDTRYYEGLFKSSMAESTQEVIEIKDCE